VNKLDELLEKVGKREEVSDELLAEACAELAAVRGVMLSAKTLFNELLALELSQ